MADNTTLPGTGDVIAADDVGGVKYQQMKLVDGTLDSADPIGVNGNPLKVYDESIALLRRMVKLMESQATVDSANRQRITVDAFTAGVSLPTVAAVTAITNALPAGTNTVGNVTVGSMDHKQFIDQARTAYNTGIRSKLTFS